MQEFLSQTIIKSNPKSCLLLKPSSFSCADGWFKIINEMCSLIEICLKEDNKLNFKFLSFQQKFGVLDTEFLGGNHLTNYIITFGQVLSYKTCEECGEVGSLHSSNGSEFGECLTLCLKDSLKRGFKKI